MQTNMIVTVIVLFSALVSVEPSMTEKLTFPPGFMFGAATSSYQVEGAWNVSDKSESVWDRFTHSHSERVSDHSTGDEACNSYRRWREDVALVSELGLQFYRFSVSWSRVLPSGFRNSISTDGVRYYNELITELLANGIQPLVTICHWDIPQRLQDLGGWSNPLMADWFAEYADLLFSQYADRVNTWITINEPTIICDMSYNTGILAPGVVDADVGTYLCSKTVLLAHAKAWRIYDEKYKPRFHGRVSLANQNIWMEGKTPAEDEYGEWANQYHIGRFSHPIYSITGGWPPLLERLINAKNKDGHIRSRLPVFTPEEIDLIKGTYDFYSLNYYTSRYVYPAKDGDQFGPFPIGDIADLRLKLGVRQNWTTGYSKVLVVNPSGLRNTMNWIVQKYGPLEFLITETGYTTAGLNLEDDGRIQFINDHLHQVLMAINEDGINVTGFTYWSLLDTFEWMDGYRTKFGLFEVDFTSPLRTRTARKSVYYYQSIIQNHSLDVPLEPSAWKEAQRLRSVNSVITNKPSTIILLCAIIVVLNQFRIPKQWINLLT